MTKKSRLYTKIRLLRRSHGISQAELALISGVSLPSISRLEKGKETIRLDVLTRILDSLGYELDIKPKISEAEGKKSNEQA